MKSNSIIWIVVVVIILVAAIGGYFLFSSGQKSSNSKPSPSANLEPITEFGKCVSPLSSDKLPASVGGFSGTVKEITEPYDWKTGPDGKKILFPVEKGYLLLYSSGSKAIMLQVIKFNNSADYNSIKSDLASIKRDAQVGEIVEKTLNGASAYVVTGVSGWVWDISDEKTVIYFIFAGDNNFIYLNFKGPSAEEAQSWIDSWKTAIC